MDPLELVSELSDAELDLLESSGGGGRNATRGGDRDGVKGAELEEGLHELSETMLQEPVDMVLGLLDVVGLVEGQQLGDRQVVPQELESWYGGEGRWRRRIWSKMKRESDEVADLSWR
jgi:hypothetical protein